MRLWGYYRFVLVSIKAIYAKREKWNSGGRREKDAVGVAEVAFIFGLVKAGRGPAVGWDRRAFSSWPFFLSLARASFCLFLPKGAGIGAWVIC